MKDKKAKAGGRAVGVIIAVSFVLLAAVMPTVLSKVIPAYENTCLGWRPLVVRTNSMEGAIRKNALIIVYAAKWDTLKVNDVITFRRPDGQLDTHRVIAKDGAHIKTKGDNAAAQDIGWVTPDNYKYKVIFIWNWAAWLSEHRGVAYLICLPPLIAMLAVGGVFIIRRTGKRRELRKESAPTEVIQSIAPPLIDPPPDGVQPDDRPVKDTRMAAEDDSWMDEMLLLLGEQLECPRGNAADKKEKPNEPTGQTNTFSAADDDSDLDWDDWFLLQLRRCAAPPCDALPAIG